MSIDYYIEILKKKPGRLFSKDPLEEKLIVLNKILDLGQPSHIRDIFPFIKDENPIIRQTVCKTIAALFSKISSKTEYSETLKYCDVTLYDLDFYENNFISDNYILLLSIASFNHSGYVREQAVKRLIVSKHKKALRFIIYRTFDWVPVIMESVFIGIERFKRPEHIETIINNLHLFSRRETMETVNLNKLYNDLIGYILNQNKDYVYQKFHTYPEQSRLILAKEITNSYPMTLVELRLFLKDKSYLVRRLALNYFDKIPDAETEQLLKDKSSVIRYLALSKLAKQKDAAEFAFSFLTDKSAAIRQLARKILADKHLDFAQIYYQNLLANRSVFSSICGLSETSGKQYIEILVPFLADVNTNIRKTAFLALSKLDEDKAINFAVDNLGNNHNPIRNAAINFLYRRPTKEGLIKARALFQNGDQHMKVVMLRFFSKIGGWATLPDIILGTVNENEHVRQLSFDYLRTWKIKAVHLYTQPKPVELERTRIIFNFAKEVVKEKDYFIKDCFYNENPLDSLDFYFRQ